MEQQENIKLISLIINKACKCNATIVISSNSGSNPELLNKQLSSYVYLTSLLYIIFIHGKTEE